MHLQRRLADEAGRLEAEGDKLHRLVVGEEAVHALMRVGKALRQEIKRLLRDRTIGQRDSQLVVLSGVAHVDGAREAARVSGDFLVDEPSVGLPVQRRKCGLDLAEHAGFERQQPRGGEVRAQIGEQQPHGAQDAGIAWHQNALDVELPGQARRVQRAGAAESHQRIVARIVAALHRDHPDGFRHIGGHDRDDALRRLHHPEAELLREAADRRLGQVVAHRHAAAEQVARIERLQHDIGVGDGGLGIALAVADRTRIGAGAARADFQ